MWTVRVCDGVTGAPLASLPVSAFTWRRALSAGSSGQVTVPLDGSLTKAEMTDLMRPWARMVELAWNDAPVFLGYVSGRDYRRGTSSVSLPLVDVWEWWGARGAWDHAAESIPKWKTTLTATRAAHARAAVLRGIDTGPTSPARALPVATPTLAGGGGNVTRTYYGYHHEYVGDVLDTLMDEGLDIYFQPRRTAGVPEWVMRGGMDWSSGVSRDVYVTAQDTTVSAFSETMDGARITNVAYRVGEGSEEDLLFGSSRYNASAYPLRERVSANKDVEQTAQLASLAAEDTRRFREPTIQWAYDTLIDDAPDVGDTVRLRFTDDPVIADGWHERRVVAVSGSLGSQVSVSVQAVGGA